MNADHIVDVGYESDTGERDNPTCANFERREPVKKLIVVGGGKKVLNRKGRAICRIVYAHKWSAAAIANIFGISDTSVSRALENTRYNPRDNVQEDYAKVDPEFRTKFPPLETPQVFPQRSTIIIDISNDEDKDEVLEAFRSNGRPERAAKLNFYSKMLESSPDPKCPQAPSTMPPKRSYEDMLGLKNASSSSHNQMALTSPVVKKPRYGKDESEEKRSSQGLETSAFSPHPQPTQISGSSMSASPSLSRASTQSQGSAPLPRRAHLPARLFNTQADVPTLSSFLKHVKPGTLAVQSDFDLSKHHTLLEAQGFSISRLAIVATWGRDAIAEAVSRLLMGSEGGRQGLSARHAISLELAIPKLKTQGSGSLTRNVNANANSTITLASFLKDVMGLDLSAHQELFEAQDFDVDDLRKIATWDRADIQEILSRVLEGDKTAIGGRKGMKPLEVFAVELAIRK
ncbi:hypothetical protein C8R44DRAFT_812149 [Mycena epipterygia]|nr:hypothetical protein C8R44DRAFT_812149 [Mycena epipterygia]